MIKQRWVLLACPFVLLTMNITSAQIHGVDDAATLTLLHFEPGDPVVGPFFDGSTVTTRLTLDDDSNSPRPNMNDAQWGRRAGFGPIFRPDLVTDMVAPVTHGTSNASVLFDDGSVDGQHDGMEVTPNFDGILQVNESGIWTEVWDGYPGFETQFWFKDNDRNPGIVDQDEALIGAATRWEIYHLNDGSGLNDSSGDPTLLLVLFGDNDEGDSGFVFATNTFTLAAC